ncbi:MAG: DUF386 family protein, partial [Elusimicrobia bacterium]|nr:DUF386 family protein [Elusimicrobiota bacterium]
SLADPTEYDEMKDCQFFSARANISSFLVREGEFAVFFSGESHRPMCAASQGPASVQKLVFKIRIKK